MTTLELIEKAEDAVRDLYNSDIRDANKNLLPIIWKLSELKYQDLSKGLEQITPFEAMCIAKGRHIEAIKSVRARTQLGLKESKDIVDNARKVWEKM